MMERDEIIRLAKKADSGFDGGPDADGTMADSIVGIDAVERFAQLVAAEYKQDAERYRWLRDQTSHDGIVVAMKNKHINEQLSYADNIDLFIDAAMEKVK